MSFRPFIAKYFQQRLYKRLNFPDSPSDDLELIVCLPAFKEPALKSALKSLESNSLDPSRYEIHVLINYPENAGQEIIQQSEISFSEISDSNVQGFVQKLNSTIKNDSDEFDVVLCEIWLRSFLEELFKSTKLELEIRSTAFVASKLQ